MSRQTQSRENDPLRNPSLPRGYQYHAFRDLCRLSSSKEQNKREVFRIDRIQRKTKSREPHARPPNADAGVPNDRMLAKTGKEREKKEKEKRRGKEGRERRREEKKKCGCEGRKRVCTISTGYELERKKSIYKCGAVGYEVMKAGPVEESGFEKKEQSRRRR